MATAQYWDVHDLRRYMLVFGLTSTVFDLLIFALLLKVFDAGEAEFQTAWFVISLLTELVVLMVLRTRAPAWRSRPSRVKQRFFARPTVRRRAPRRRHRP